MYGYKKSHYEVHSGLEKLKAGTLLTGALSS